VIYRANARTQYNDADDDSDYNCDYYYHKQQENENDDILFTMQWYARSVCAMALCPSVCLSVCQVRVLSQCCTIAWDSSFQFPKITVKFE